MNKYWCEDFINFVSDTKYFSPLQPFQWESVLFCSNRFCEWIFASKIEKRKLINIYKLFSHLMCSIFDPFFRLSLCCIPGFEKQPQIVSEVITRAAKTNYCLSAVYRQISRRKLIRKRDQSLVSRGGKHQSSPQHLDAGFHHHWDHNMDSLKKPKMIRFSER